MAEEFTQSLPKWDTRYEFLSPNLQSQILKAEKEQVCLASPEKSGRERWRLYLVEGIMAGQLNLP